MSQAKTSSVDTLIVGASLAGLYAAAIAARQGKKVLVLESKSHVGGRWSPETRDGYQLGSGFSFADSEAWEMAYSSVSLPFQSVSCSNGECLVYNPKGWQKAEDLPSWEKYFARPITRMPEGGIAGFVNALMEANHFELRLESPVIKLEVEEGKAIRAITGKDDIIEFKECRWAADSITLINALDGTGIPEPGAARMAWMRNFVISNAQPGVVLEFAHKFSVSDFTETLAMPLPGDDKKAQRRYVIGAFASNRDQSLVPKGRQLSTWIFPLAEEEWGDNHIIMKRIKAANRLLEKSFPGFGKTIAFERVQVMKKTIAFPKRKKPKSAGPILENLFPISDWAALEGAHFEGTFQHIQENASL